MRRLRLLGKVLYVRKEKYLSVKHYSDNHFAPNPRLVLSVVCEISTFDVLKLKFGLAKSSNQYNL